MLFTSAEVSGRPSWKRTPAEMENIGDRIRCFPGFSKIAVEIHLIVAVEQAVEEQSIETLRLRIGGKAWIEK